MGGKSSKWVKNFCHQNQKQVKNLCPREIKRIDLKKKEKGNVGPCVVITKDPEESRPGPCNPK